MVTKTTSFKELFNAAHAVTVFEEDGNEDNAYNKWLTVIKTLRGPSTPPVQKRQEPKHVRWGTNCVKVFAATEYEAVVDGFRLMTADVCDDSDLFMRTVAFVACFVLMIGLWIFKPIQGGSTIWKWTVRTVAVPLVTYVGWFSVTMFDMVHAATASVLYRSVLITSIPVYIGMCLFYLICMPSSVAKLDITMTNVMAIAPFLKYTMSITEVIQYSLVYGMGRHMVHRAKISAPPALFSQTNLSHLNHGFEVIYTPVSKNETCVNINVNNKILSTCEWEEFQALLVNRLLHVEELYIDDVLVNITEWKEMAMSHYLENNPHPETVELFKAIADDEKRAKDQLKGSLKGYQTSVPEEVLEKRKSRDQFTQVDHWMWKMGVKYLKSPIPGFLNSVPALLRSMLPW